MDIFEKAGIDAGYVILGLLAVQFILIILFLVLFVQHSKMKKRYETFLQGESGNNLEKSILKKFAEIDRLTQENAKLMEDVKQNHNDIQVAFQKVGLVKYDAFKEMGGRLSFSLCLLDNNDNGFLITSMHTREGCYTYSKEIIKGESYVVLAEEEKHALEQAKERAGSEELEHDNKRK
ncbi:MAG: DUF4446 family protein [Lachnospiraceae bacterium]|nr:DUF4446 family protein [Lachnospiraceae bacterium]